MNLGERIKTRRLELGLTLEEVGKIVDVSKSTVMKWETGYIENMKRDKIALLAKALKVSPLWIMGIDEEIDNVKDTEPLDKDIQLIQRAHKKMNEKQRKKMMDLLKLSFEDLFKEEDE